ncbi:MAG: cell division protein SepF [Acidimicrobiia bacterium]
MAQGGLRKLWVFLGLQDDGEYDEYTGFDEAPATDARVADAGAPAGSMLGPARSPARSPRESSPATVREVRPAEGPSVRTIPKTEHPTVVAQRPAVIRTVVNGNARVHVVEPRGFNDAQEVGDRLKNNQPVVINMQDVDRDLQRRLIDFSSGLCYALGGSMSRVADQVFMLTPAGAAVSEEEKQRLAERGLYQA